MRAAARFADRPFTESIDAIGQPPMLFIAIAVTVIVKATEVTARLDQRRDTPGQPITFRMTLAQLSRKQIGQFNLANFAFNFRVGHRRIQIVLEARFSQQLDK